MCVCVAEVRREGRGPGTMFASAEGTAVTSGQPSWTRACGGPPAAGGTVRPGGSGPPPPAQVAGARPPRRAVVRSSLAGLWEHLGQSPPAGSVVAAELSSGSGGCCRGRAVRLGRARTWRFGSAPAPRSARSGRSAGACVAPDSPSQRWCEPRARLSPAAAADPGPPLHGRLGAAPTGQAGGRWRPRTAPCAAQHREEAGQGR